MNCANPQVREMSELNMDELNSVSGGVIFVAPVAMKILAWSAGAVFGLSMAGLASQIM